MGNAEWGAMRMENLIDPIPHSAFRI
jgi:hypothetical protein